MKKEVKNAIFLTEEEVWKLHNEGLLEYIRQLNPDGSSYWRFAPYSEEELDEILLKGTKFFYETKLQKIRMENVQKYLNIPFQEKINVIAKALGCNTGEIRTSPCSGKWRGNSDIYIVFDNGNSFGIGNNFTPVTKTKRYQNKCLNEYMIKFNPEMIKLTKEIALTNLKELEEKDRAVALAKGLTPYKVLSVEFIDATGDYEGYYGWFYVMIAVGDKIHSHLESGLNMYIHRGSSIDERRKEYFVGGGIKEEDVDYVFNNVGHSTTSEMYTVGDIPEETVKRAEETLKLCS